MTHTNTQREGEMEGEREREKAILIQTKDELKPENKTEGINSKTIIH